MAELLKGKAVADAITDGLILKTKELKAKGIVPTLAILRVGEAEADMSYERNAVKRCEKAGIAVRAYHLPQDAGREAVLSTVKEINEDPAVHSCLVLRPLKDKETEAAVGRLLDPKKDADCMTDSSMAGIFLGRKGMHAPCTAQSCIEILDYYGIDVSGKNVCVIGRSPVIGKPVSMMLQSRNATVTMCHTKTVDTPSIASKADILVVAAGRAGLVDKSYTNPNQVIIDVGINIVDGRLTGDVDFESCSEVCRALTPVPGGVGSVTTSVLAKAVVRAAESQVQSE